MNYLDWKSSDALDIKTRKYLSGLLFRKNICQIIAFVIAFGVTIAFAIGTNHSNILEMFQFVSKILLIVEIVSVVILSAQAVFIHKGHFSWACGFLTDFDYGDPGGFKRRRAFLSDFKIPAVYVNDERCDWLNNKEILGFSSREIQRVVGFPMVVVKAKFSLWPRYACFYEIIP